MSPFIQSTNSSTPVRIPLGRVAVAADLVVPPMAEGIVIFAQGSESSRPDARYAPVAAELNEAGFATLIVDALHPRGERAEPERAVMRSAVPVVAARLLAVTEWIAAYPETAGLAIGYFGMNADAVAACVAATRRPKLVQAVVSVSGRDDVSSRPPHLGVPTLLIAGGKDAEGVAIARQTSRQAGDIRLQVVPEASRAFAEPGSLEEATRLARQWFRRHLHTSSDLPQQDAGVRAGRRDVLTFPTARARPHSAA